MDAINALFTRRSTREFTEQPMESEKLHQILDAAIRQRTSPRPVNHATKKTGYISMRGNVTARTDTSFKDCAMVSPLLILCFL